MDIRRRRCSLSFPNLQPTLVTLVAQPPQELLAFELLRRCLCVLDPLLGFCIGASVTPSLSAFLALRRVHARASVGRIHDEECEREETAERELGVSEARTQESDAR